jgi:hypothetical protein
MSNWTSETLVSVLGLKIGSQGPLGKAYVRTGPNVRLNVNIAMKITCFISFLLFSRPVLIRLTTSKESPGWRLQQRRIPIAVTSRPGFLILCSEMPVETRL